MSSTTTPDMYIHIPLDIFDDASSYRTPTTVNLELGPGLTGRRSVGVYPSPKDDSSIVGSNLTQSVTGRQPKEVGNPRLWGHVKKMVPVMGLDRDMDGEDETQEDNFDFIDVVAKANDTAGNVSETHFLPEIRSSPCLIHHRSHHQHYLPLHQQQQQQRSDARNDLLYSTNCHAGHNNNCPSRASRRSDSSGRQEENRLQMERDITFQRDINVGKSQTYSRPKLPTEMTSEDFVSSWLEYGSEPEGKSHFPGVMGNKTDRNKNSHPLQNKGRKQTLSPIKPTHFPGRLKSKSNISE